MKTLLLSLLILSLPQVVFAAQGKALILATSPESNVSGHVTLTEEKGGITLETMVVNVSPGKHGFHIHENGSCADGGKAAGGHFNPDKVDHGFLPLHGHQKSHAGDMGNIAVAQDGTGILKIFMPDLTLKEGLYAVLGKTVILHEKIDDLGQPTGNAGGRIGCGIIELDQ